MSVLSGKSLWLTWNHYDCWGMQVITLFSIRSQPCTMDIQHRSQWCVCKRVKNIDHQIILPCLDALLSCKVVQAWCVKKRNEYHTLHSSPSWHIDRSDSIFLTLVYCAGGTQEEKAMCGSRQVASVPALVRSDKRLSISYWSASVGVAFASVDQIMSILRGRCVRGDFTWAQCDKRSSIPWEARCIVKQEA